MAKRRKRQATLWERGLPEPFLRVVEQQNPWWRGEALPPTPGFRRWPFERMLRRIKAPLAPILVLRGHRQIGKTTLQLQLIERLLAGEGVAPNRILRVQFDEIPSGRLLTRQSGAEPILYIAKWFEQAILGETLNAAARRGAPAFLFLDEVQNLPDWGAQLKSLVDHAAARVVVTGSSALRIERGRDSLAGRITTIEAGPLRISEIAALRGIEGVRPFQEENGWDEWLDPGFWRSLNAHARNIAAPLRRAFKAYADRGGYPLAHQAHDAPWPELADQLTETVVRRVIQHDLRVGERGRRRDPQLLEEVFRLACRYAGQSPTVGRLTQEIHGRLDTSVGDQRVRHYVDFLDSALLIRKVPALEMRLKKAGGPPKLCLSDHAVRAAWLQERVPLFPGDLAKAPDLAEIAGHIAESCLGSFLLGLAGLDVAYRPQRKGQPEIDFVLTIGDRRIPIEVKYQSKVDPRRDGAAAREFVANSMNRAPFGLLVTRSSTIELESSKLIAVPLSHALVLK